MSFFRQDRAINTFFAAVRLKRQVGPAAHVAIVGYVSHFQGMIDLSYCITYQSNGDVQQVRFYCIEKWAHWQSMFRSRLMNAKANANAP